MKIKVRKDLVIEWLSHRNNDIDDSQRLNGKH
jgi:hypothetical protein